MPVPEAAKVAADTYALAAASERSDILSYRQLTIALILQGNYMVPTAGFEPATY